MSGVHAVMAGQGGGGPSFELRATYAVNPATITHAYPAVDFGLPWFNRCIIIAVASTGRPLVSATIGGVAATIHQSQSDDDDAQAAIISAVVPLGTVGDVVLTFSAANGGSLIAVYAERGGRTYRSGGVDSAGDNADFTLNTLADGVTVAAVSNFNFLGPAYSGQTGFTTIDVANVALNATQKRATIASNYPTTAVTSKAYQIAYSTNNASLASAAAHFA